MKRPALAALLGGLALLASVALAVVALADPMYAKVIEDSQVTGPIKLKLPQIVMFTEELSDLLSAGIQLEPALGTMERRRELSGVKTLATVLRSKIRDGMSFSKAVAGTSPSCARPGIGFP